MPPEQGGGQLLRLYAWLNAVRSQFTIKHDLQTDMRTVAVGKAIYARKGEQLRFAWVDWALVHEDDLPPDTARQLADTAKAHAGNDAFLRCLALCTEQRRNVSHVPGSNYAPAIFAKMPAAKGMKRADFEAALERLLGLNVIECDAELWRGPDRKPRSGIRLVEGGE